jgi:hypothetical protein
MFNFVVEFPSILVSLRGTEGLLQSVLLSNLVLFLLTCIPYIHAIPVTDFVKRFPLSENSSLSNINFYKGFICTLLYLESYHSHDVTSIQKWYICQMYQSWEPGFRCYSTWAIVLQCIFPVSLRICTLRLCLCVCRKWVSGVAKTGSFCNFILVYLIKDDILGNILSPVTYHISALQLTSTPQRDAVSWSGQSGL